MKVIVAILFCFTCSICFGQGGKDFRKAEIALSKKDYQSAIKFYSIALDSNYTDSFYVHLKRGDCYYELNDLKASEKDFILASQINKHNLGYKEVRGIAYWMLGRVYSKLGELEKSLKSYKEATKYMESSSLLSSLALKEIQLGKSKPALAHLNKSIELDDMNAYAFNNRALLYVKFKKYDKARSDVNKSIELDFKNPYAFKHSALIYIELKDFDNACKELNKSKNLGYKEFGNEADKNEVDELLQKYCNSK